jgi:hypothetical protein
MCRKLVLCLCVVLFPAVIAMAQDTDNGQETEAKELSVCPSSVMMKPEVSLYRSVKARKSVWRPA